MRHTPLTVLGVAVLTVSALACGTDASSRHGSESSVQPATELRATAELRAFCKGEMCPGEVACRCPEEMTLRRLPEASKRFRWAAVVHAIDVAEEGDLDHTPDGSSMTSAYLLLRAVDGIWHHAKMKSWAIAAAYDLELATGPGPATLIAAVSDWNGDYNNDGENTEHWLCRLEPRLRCFSVYSAGEEKLDPDNVVDGSFPDDQSGTRRCRKDEGLVRFHFVPALGRGDVVRATETRAVPCTPSWLKALAGGVALDTLLRWHQAPTQVEVYGERIVKSRTLDARWRYVVGGK